MRPSYISLCGPDGHMKTVLVENLILALTKRGQKVSALKYITETCTMQVNVDPYFHDTDIVLIDGFRDSNLPEDKILLIQKVNPEMRALIGTLKDRVMAIISKNERQSSLPVFSPMAIEQIADFIIHKLFASC